MQKRVDDEASARIAAQECLAGAQPPGQQSGTVRLAELVEQYVETQNEETQKPKKKGVLSYSLANRIEEVDHQNIPYDSKPIEEVVVKWQKAGKAAEENGGNTLALLKDQLFKPIFFRAGREHQVWIIAGEGSFEDKVKTPL